MFLRIVLFLSLFSLTSQLSAQKGCAFTFGIGSAYYHGDISESLNNAYIRPAVTASMTYYLKPQLGIRFGLSHGTIGADDRLATDPVQQQRAIHFRSKITEFGFTGVYEFIKDGTFGEEDGKKATLLTPYAFGGITLMAFNPEAQFTDGRWYSLKAMTTEGRTVNISTTTTKIYSQVLPTFPLGIGASYRFRKSWAINAEFGYRFTGSDHLDDLGGRYSAPDAFNGPGVREKHFADPSGLNFEAGTPRGDMSNNDGYTFGTVSLTFFFDNKNPK